MKKTCAILLAVALLLLAGCALAEQSMVARSGVLAAYLDGEGHLYVPGNEQPLNRADADGLISIDPYRVLFTSEQGDGTRDLYMIDLGSLEERMLAKNVCDACMADEDTLYYVSGANRAQLMRMDMKTMSVLPDFIAAEPIDRLYNSAEGLVFEQVDGTGTMIYNRQTGTFDSYLGALPNSGLRTDSFELYLLDGDLYIRDLTSLASEHIDSGVRDYAVMNGGVYYLCSGGSATRLKCYDPAQMTWQVVLTLDSSMERQLTASAGKLFMLDYRGQVYAVNLETGALDPFVSVPDTSGYKLPKGYDVTGLKIEAMDGQLNVYAELIEAASQPSFSFIEFTASSDSALPVMRLLERRAIEGEQAAWTRLEPAAQYSPLSRGSRGKAVRTIQRHLYDLGYYDYYVDGIFGPRTQYAVRLLQSDLERPVTGVADPELQRLLIKGGLPHYDAYLALTRGNRGMRVQIMQETLRDLGYLADAADGIFGANTQRAVQLFQSENGLDISDGATRETLKMLYSGAASRCESYIDLYPGYTGCRVRELNNRLRALYYLEYNPGGSYTFETAEAVRAFQRCAGLPVNGNATASVVRKLFSRYAPECPGYIALRRGDENDRVAALQRRLKALNYYSGAIDGYFGKSTEKAVKLFQKKVELKASGSATVRTQALLFSKGAPVYVKPTVIGVPLIGVDRYDAFQDNIYYIDDGGVAGDYVSFNWYAEGEVKEYSVMVQDARGGRLFNQKTMLARTGVTLGTLEPDLLYTLTVTAYPEDGNKKHITSDSVRFMRRQKHEEPVIPPVGKVGDPEIFIKTVLRTQGGVQYVQPGEIAFHWHADGEVDKYYIEIYSYDGDVILTQNAREEQTTLDSSKLVPGKTYTIFVYAIPSRGTIENATTAAGHFGLEDPSLPLPAETPDEPGDGGDASVPSGGSTDGTTDSSTDGTTDGTPEGEPEVPADDAGASEPASGAVSEVTDGEVAPEETPEEIPEVIPEEIPEEAPEENPEEAPELPPEEVPEVGGEPETAAPAIVPPKAGFETTLEAHDDITYVADDVLTMFWEPQAGVREYYVEVVDGDGAVLASKTLEDTRISAPKGSMAPGVTYTLNVTAIPEDGGEGVTSSTAFALYPEAQVDAEAPEAEQPPAEEPVYEEPAVEQPPVEEPVYEEPAVEQPPVEEPSIEEPYTEEPYVEEPYAEEPYTEEPYTEEPYTEEPYTEEPYVEEPPVEQPPVEQPPVEQPPVEQPPVEQPPVEEPPVEQPPVEEPPAEGANGEPVLMDAETTARVQEVLVAWNWLAGDAFEPGVVNEATLAAINAFEGYYNMTFGDSLASVDGMVDARTLALLLNQEGATYIREG